MNDILVVKLDFICSEQKYRQIYENILKQMDVGLVVLPHGHDAFVVHKDFDLKVENRALKNATHNNCNTCKHRKTPRNFNKCLICHNNSNYEEDENYGC